ncbi:hypothetical protein R5W23_000863, partial [Gemmata sp. JC673]
ELEVKFPRKPSTGMVPDAGLAIGAARQAWVRERNAQGTTQAEERREELLRRAAAGEDLGAARVVHAGGAFDAVVTSLANGKGGAR